MADQYAQFSQNNEKKNNRVYINPNFNRTDNYSSSNMYLNRNFTHDAPNPYHNTQKHPIGKARIHVNPNFIRNTNVINPIVANRPKEAIGQEPSPSMSYSLCKNQDTQGLSQALPLPVTKSRYCLVRQKENLVATTPNLKPVTTTVRVNKYKSVSINVVKKNLATGKPAISTIDTSYSQKEKYGTDCKTIIGPTNNTRFKFVKSNNVYSQSPLQTKNVTVRRYSSYNKIIPKPVRKISDKLVLKKNNIPCPLFKKYGVCLRKIRGKCEYLHDKKHVSICRKFLKGICHSENCLLSHDLTDKKMPTCYFYLQGSCIKENCPYLHVKLNEKTKTCYDFLRGYCENGDRCLFRHINVGAMTSKQHCTKKVSNFTPVRDFNSVEKVKNQSKWVVMRQKQNNSNAKVKDYPADEPRYFKESVEVKCSDEKCDMIKPSRIKLGTLPSFIQL